MSSISPANGRAGRDRRRKLSNRPVMTKVLVPVALALVGIGAVGVLGNAGVGRTSGTAQSMYSRTALPLADLGRVRDAEGDARVLVRDRVTASTTADAKSDDDQIKEADKAMDAALTAFTSDSGPGLDNASKALLAKFTAAWTNWKSVRDTDVLPAAVKGEAAVADHEISTTLATADDAFGQPLDDLYQRVTDAAETSAKDAHNVAARTRTELIALSIVACLLALVGGVAIARAISRPLRQVLRVLVAVADGDLTSSVDVEGRDELGTMAGALNTAVGNMRAAVKTMAESSEALDGSSSLVGDFAARIATAAEQASAQAATVATAAEQISGNVQNVSAGAEEMTASIGEISSSAHSVAQVAAQATAQAQSTNETIANLGRSSAAIGDVIKLITSVAQQTNLLALNATIEAARAGEAGKGFAVVASEVKELAQEAARASEDVTRRIETIQGDAESAVVSIREIGQTIARISDFQTSIATAVEEQSAITVDVARTAAQAASGTAQIAAGIVDVSTAARTTTKDAADSRKAAQEMAELSGALRTAVGHFRY